MLDKSGDRTYNRNMIERNKIKQNKENKMTTYRILFLDPQMVRHTDTVVAASAAEVVNAFWRKYTRAYTIKSIHVA